MEWFVHVCSVAVKTIRKQRSSWKGQWGQRSSAQAAVPVASEDFVSLDQSEDGQLRRAE